MPTWFKASGSSGDHIDELTSTINGYSDEQRKVMGQFDRAMNAFASERSLDTCLDALNLAMQLANIRARLAESYEHYARLLEKEITALTRKSH